MSDFDDALDALETPEGTTIDDLDGGKDDEQAKLEQEDAGEDEEEGAEEQGEEEGDPPGYLDPEAWVASGKSMDDFRGKNAYKNEYGRIQDNREMKSKIDGLETTMRHIGTSQQQLLADNTAKAKAEVMQELADAKEASDVDGVLDAATRLAEINRRPAAQPPQQNQVRPAISDFRANNPLVDRDNPRFNQEFTADFEAIYDNKLRSIDPGNGQFTDAQIKRTMTAALKEASGSFPELFKSTRNNRQTGPRKVKGNPPKASSDYRAQLKGIGGHARNDGDKNAAVDMYDDLLKRGGKEAADNFAKANLGVK